jgi:pyruvate formate lyase activating enzyme
LPLSGLIFNIQRFSIHDGPGIRTTVFFKGCPLRCFWCHNPEGLSTNPELLFYSERCLFCGQCVQICTSVGHDIHEAQHTILRDRCNHCGRCADECVSNAVELAGKVMTVEQVLAEVLADRVFYQTSGGGVTLSGGEPLLQPKFALAVLKECKVKGLHTTLETCGHARWSVLSSLLPHLDLILMDLKLVNPHKHRAVTGVSNRLILENATRLAAMAIPIHFRIPVVPTVNDTEEEIVAIRQFVQSLIALRSEKNGRDAAPITLELLPFHKMAGDKYRRLDLTYDAAELTALDPERMQLLEKASVLLQ